MDGSDRIPGIYFIICSPISKKYIGSTTLPIYRRWAHHKTRLRQGKHVDPVLQRDWSKYGEEAFEFVVAENVEDDSMVTVREQWYIEEALKADRTKTYNTNSKVTRPKTKEERGFAERHKSFGRREKYGD
jgi:group I intron endonuclease